MTISKQNAEIRAKRKAYSGPAAAIKTGDMVVVPDGSIGLLMHLNLTSKGAAVIFGNNGSPSYFNWQSLRRATMAEIKAAGLHGVGCNQAYD